MVLTLLRFLDSFVVVVVVIVDDAIVVFQLMKVALSLLIILVCFSFFK